MQLTNKTLQAFTLIEIMVVLLLVSLLYYFAINNNTLLIKKDQKINITNLKQFLLNQQYKNNASIICFDNSFDCVLYLDNKPTKTNFKLFDTNIAVYQYDQNLIQKQYPNNIVFSYSCDFFNKCTNQIINLKDKFYIFNDINLKPTIVNSTNQLQEYFTKPKEELKYAF